MSFIKKLFGLGNKESVEEVKAPEQPESEQAQINEQEVEDDIEVVVHDTDDWDSFELLNDEDKEEAVYVEKSIEEIIGDVTEVNEKLEKEALEETYETFVDQNTQLKDEMGIFEIKDEVEIEVTEHRHDATELLESEIEEKTVGVLEGNLVSKELKEVKIETIEEATDTTVTETLVEEVVEVELEQEKVEEVESEEATDETEVETVETETVEVKQDKKSFFAKLKEGVKKTRDSIFGNLNSVFNMFTTIDEDLFEELEEALILADMGVDTSLYIINELRKRVKKNGITEVHQVKETLINIISEILNKDEEEFIINKQTVILVIGVNGAGKTTTIGKLSNNFIKSGKSVTVAAADTFRAAAIEQLQVWAERTGAHLIRKEEGSDPASVVFDACKSAKAKNTDILIVDTAGRLQNKKNLMEELKKINRIIEREFPEAQREVFLVLDSTTGQNAMQQAKLFNETADITGLILTKLDGTAKGGVIVSIKNELNVPVRYVGLGEKVDDLEPFDSKQFAKAMFE